MLVAAFIGHVDKVEEALNKNANINVKEPDVSYTLS